MKKVFLVFSTLLFAFTLQSNAANTPKRDKDLTNQIDQLIQHRLPNANIGVVVMDAQNGKILYDKNGFQPFTPASNMKLFVSSAALFYLGPKYTYKTSIGIKPNSMKNRTIYGNLYVKFTGDPSLKVKDLKELIAKTKHYGVKVIKGNIIIDDTRFKKPDYAPGLAIDDIKWSFAAPINSIILNKNSVYVRLTPSRTLGKKANIMPGKYTRYADFSQDVTTVKDSYANTRCPLVIDVSENNDINMSGCWPITSPIKHFNVALKSPLLFAKKIILNELRKNNIKLTGTIETDKMPNRINIIAQHESRSLQNLLCHVLKNSNNVYAESITKTLGYEFAKRGNFQTGVSAIRDILSKRTDIDFNKMVIVDGAGSRYNLASPRQITRLLYVVLHSPKISSTFVKALPASGTNGTLKRRMKSFDLAKYIRAKTGTMTGVSALSGYATTLHGKKLVFSILVNHVVGSVRTAKTLQNEICNLLVQYG